MYHKIAVLHMSDGNTKIIIDGLDPDTLDGVAINYDDEFNVIDVHDLVIGDPAELVSIQQDLAAMDPSNDNTISL